MKNYKWLIGLSCLLLPIIGQSQTIGNSPTVVCEKEIRYFYDGQKFIPIYLTKLEDASGNQIRLSDINMFTNYEVNDTINYKQPVISNKVSTHPSVLMNAKSAIKF